ncbi:MAG: AAA family ATPase [Ignavibacteria bacterium]|nr:AAA family ATPase [Ignavibacteria bacterium]
MAVIEGFRVKNFRALKDVTLGKLWNTQYKEPLTPMTVVIGKNGVGKSSLFDAFGFLSDCLKNGVEEACEMRGRGGFNTLISKEQEGTIDFEIYFKQESKSQPITYELSIGVDKNDRAYVKKERLRQRRKGQKDYGRPFSFLILENGRGIVWSGTTNGIDEENQDLENLFNQIDKNKNKEESRDKEKIELEDIRKLGISTLGALKQHPRISFFRKFLEGWYLSYFTPDAARSLPLAGPQKQLNIHGDNLGNVVQFFEREHKDKFNKILARIASKIPGIETITTERTADNRLLVKFTNRGFKEPFYAQQMSDGTLKVFAYLLLLEDPNPASFLCIEEPENGLYHKLLETLAVEFREHAEDRRNPSQIFITTHQPYFVDALKPEEVWILEKDSTGFSTIRRASDDPLIKNMASEELPLGGLWYSDYLDAR